MEFEKMTLEKFKGIRGKGQIWVNDELIDEFNEVICDFCNGEIKKEEDKKEEVYVYINDIYAICEECFYEDDKNKIKTYSFSQLDKKTQNEIVRKFRDFEVEDEKLIKVREGLEKIKDKLGMTIENLIFNLFYFSELRFTKDGIMIDE